MDETKYVSWYVAYDPVNNAYVAAGMEDIAHRRFVRKTLGELATVLAHESAILARPEIFAAVSFRLPAEKIDDSIERVIFFAGAAKLSLDGGLRELTPKEHDQFIKLLGRAVKSHKKD